MKVKLRTVGIALLIAGAVAIAGAGLFVYFGIYNIAALVQHTKPVYTLLDYALGRSVKARAASVVVPDLSSRQRVLRGAGHYREHCLQCHGAPGMAPRALAFGMTPEPVNLVATAREWPAREIYWVVKYGIKMSGMPAWEYRMSDEDLWDTVAFVATLPTLSPADYAALDKASVAQHMHQHRDGGREPATGVDRSFARTLPQPAPAGRPQQDGLPGNVEAGRLAVGQYLCATCHVIPGVVGATRHVGPPLNGIAGRKYIGGVLSNNPENMVAWLQNPQRFDPLSAMPNLGVTEQDARDMTAFLYTLEDIQ